MAKTVFSCSNCGVHGTVSFKEDESRFEKEVVFCAFCGADLDLARDDDIDLEYEE